MILNFVWAGLAALGALCDAVWYHSGSGVGTDWALLYFLRKTGGLRQLIAVLLPKTILALTDGTLLVLALSYFKTEHADGTLFTKHGDGQLLRLGMNNIRARAEEVIREELIFV